MSSLLQQSLPPLLLPTLRGSSTPPCSSGLALSSLITGPFMTFARSSLFPTPSPDTPSSTRSSLTRVWKTELDSSHASLLAEADRPRLRPFALQIVNLTLHLGLPYQTVEYRTYPWPPSVPSSDTSLARDGCSRDVG